MDYAELIKYAFEERNKFDAAVENIVRLNGNGSLFRMGEPAVVVKPHGKWYQIENVEGLFLPDKETSQEGGVQDSK